MTELQHDDRFLADLLSIDSETGEADTAGHAPALTSGQAQALLREANQAAPPTLAPSASADAIDGSSFAAEVAEAIRRHPLPALLAAVGAAYLLTRRRR